MVRACPLLALEPKVGLQSGKGVPAARFGACGAHSWFQTGKGVPAARFVAQGGFAK